VGVGTGATWDALLAGKSGIGPLTKFDPARYSTRIAGEVRGFDPLEFVDKKEARKMDPFIRYAVAAAEFAVRDSGIPLDRLATDRCGVYIGSGIGGIGSIEEWHSVLLEKGPDRISPFFLVSAIINEASGQVSIRFGAKGPNSASVTACASGSHAVGDAARIIARGEAEIMIAGGTEAPITPLGVAGFCAMKALSERNDEPARASRPFEAGRDGFVMSEGSGVLVLEELGHAVKRGAKIYAEVVGYGMTSDAFHVAAPPEDGDGAIRAMRRALDDAGVPPSVVQYINAHGTSTQLNDKIETAAVKAVFGEHARKLAISSTKSMTGHALGAAGGIEAGICALALREQMLPPTINYEVPDPACDLDYVPNVSRAAEVVYAMSNSFGFGGTNAALLFRRFDG
jgi:3-oxoacyl-[acyl-carrier-protein] synthase II